MAVVIKKGTINGILGLKTITIKDVTFELSMTFEDVKSFKELFALIMNDEVKALERSNLISGYIIELFECKDNKELCAFILMNDLEFFIEIAISINLYPKDAKDKILNNAKKEIEKEQPKN